MIFVEGTPSTFTWGGCSGEPSKIQIEDGIRIDRQAVVQVHAEGECTESTNAGKRGIPNVWGEG